MTFKPLKNLVLVLPEEAQDRAGSIFLPEQSRKSSMRGTVVSAGPQATLAPGDKVMVPVYGGSEIKMSGKTHRLLKEDDILAKLGE